MQKVKIVTLFVKPKYQKFVVPLHRRNKTKYNEYQKYHHSRSGIACIDGMQWRRKTGESYEDRG